MSKELSWTTKILLKIADLLAADVEIKSIATDKGELFLVDAEEPAVGVPVYILDENGAQVMPDDGEYQYNGDVLVVENGVIVDIRDTNTTESTEDMGKIKKLEGEVGIDEIVSVVNEIADTVNEIIVKEGLGGDVDLVEELSKVNQHLSKVKHDLSQMESITTKTVVALEEIGKKSNGKFAEPNPDPSPKAKKVPSTKDIVNYFKK